MNLKEIKGWVGVTFNIEMPSSINEWESEWVIQFNSLSQIVDSKVHVIHISHVIITYTLESASQFNSSWPWGDINI